MPRSCRPSLRSAALAVVIGLIASIAVAWTVAWCVHEHMWLDTTEHRERHGTLRWPYAVPDGWPDVAEDCYDHRSVLGYRTSEWSASGKPIQRRLRMLIQ